jgi:hypothetical protein
MDRTEIWQSAALRVHVLGGGKGMHLPSKPLELGLHNIMDGIYANFLIRATRLTRTRRLIHTSVSIKSTASPSAVHINCTLAAWIMPQ